VERPSDLMNESFREEDLEIPGINGPGVSGAPLGKIIL